MLTYLVSSKDELERIEHIEDLKTLFPDLVSIDAIYPKNTRIPFYSQIKSISKARTGSALSDGALGCLLSHRIIWRRFLNQKDQEFCLILESDSQIDNLTIIKSHQASIKAQYDLFFWGAFDNRMKLLQSTKNLLCDQYQIGTPLVNSLYCTYGYSINRNAATYLLESTCKFDYPVDYWKLRLKDSSLKVGGILPNIISTVTSFKSTISHSNQNLFVLIFDTIINFKNSIISFFK
jgi:GR25 family glycosyltransferase involved in LPS biosynthesis